MVVSFSGGGNPDKTADQSQDTDKLYHIMFYKVQLAMNGVRTDNFIGNMHWVHMEL